MKHIIQFCLTVFFITMMFSCAEDGIDGAPGPAGPDGKDGIPGPAGESAYLFEFGDVVFSPDFNHEYTLVFEENFLLNTDKVLVYFLWDYIEADDLDIWRTLPQTVFTDKGTLVYNYDFTKNDVRLFAEANYELTASDSLDQRNWVVRTVVVPSKFPTRTSVDYNNYEEVIKHYGLEDTEPTALFGKTK